MHETRDSQISGRDARLSCARYMYHRVDINYLIIIENFHRVDTS